MKKMIMLIAFSSILIVTTVLIVIDAFLHNLPRVTLLLVVRASHKSFALTFKSDATGKDDETILLFNIPQ